MKASFVILHVLAFDGGACRLNIIIIIIMFFIEETCFATIMAMVPIDKMMMMILHFTCAGRVLHLTNGAIPSAFVFVW